MSQEMYDIFARLNKIEASVQPKPEVLKEAAATAVESKKDRVDEKYMGWKKTVAAIKKGGSAENPEAVAAAIGRKKYGKEKFQKAAASGKKLGEVVTLKPGAKERLEKEKQGKADAAAALATKMSGPPTVSLKKQPMGEAAKPDFLDLDKDGNKKEPMKKAAKEKLEEAMCRECGMAESKCSCDKEMVDEMFFYDLPDTKKDRGPRDTGTDELARREKVLGKGGLGKHGRFGKEYKEKDRYGDSYKIAGPKGRLPEGDDGDLFNEPGEFRAKSKAKTSRSGEDELARRAKLGKHPMVKHGRDLLDLRKGRKKGFGGSIKVDPDYEKYKIDGPKGRLPEGNDGDLANNYPPYDKVTRGDVVAGRLGKDQMGGKKRAVKEKLSPGEMKAFAALAEPKDKVTYADKIAGAKKRRPRMHEAEIEEERSSKGTPFDPETAKTHSKDNKTTHSGRHDISKSKAGGTVYSKRFKDDEDEEETSKSSEKKGRGRPKKHTDEKPRQERVTAKSRKKDRTAHGQSGFKADKKKHVDEMGYGSLNYEDHMMGPDHGEYDQEGDMAKDQLHTIVKAAKELHGILGDEQNLPEWVQSKITKALDYINASRDYMDQEESDMDHEMIGEKEKFMGMVHSMQKGGRVKGASPELKKVARTMKKSDAEDFAATKHKGLPKRVKAGKPVGEDGGAGGIEAEKPYRDEKSGKMVQPPRGATNPPQDPVSPAKKPAKAPVSKRADADTTSDEQVAETDKNVTDTASKKSKGGGGMTFGKGIYDSMNRDLESMIAENMDINVAANSEGDKTLSVNARDEDAEALARLLMMAGIGGHSDGYDKVCPSCGSPECQCDMVDEAVSDNEPDYPENMAQGQDTDFMTQTIAGGLNRRKPDITTLPATMVRNMDESVESDLWQKLRTLKANQ